MQCQVAVFFPPTPCSWCLSDTLFNIHQLLVGFWLVQTLKQNRRQKHRHFGGLALAASKFPTQHSGSCPGICCDLFLLSFLLLLPAAIQSTAWSLLPDCSQRLLDSSLSSHCMILTGLCAVFQRLKISINPLQPMFCCMLCDSFHSCKFTLPRASTPLLCYRTALGSWVSFDQVWGRGSLCARSRFYKVNGEEAHTFQNSSQDAQSCLRRAALWLLSFQGASLQMVFSGNPNA